MSRQHASAPKISASCRVSAKALLCALGLAIVLSQTMAQDERHADPSATEAPRRAVAASVNSAGAHSDHHQDLHPATIDAGGDTGLLNELQIMRAVTAINQARAHEQVCGDQRMSAVAPIRWDANTMRAARTQALFLQRANQFGHVGQNGSHVGDRLKATGYQWQKVGENLAAGFNSIEEVVISWLASPPHCRVLMAPEFSVAGVSFVAGEEDNTYANYWALVMATPRLAN